MRAIIFATLSFAAVAHATSHAEAQTPLPEITVSPPPLRGTDVPANTNAGSGDGRKQENVALDRLNKQLKRKVDETNPSENNPPIDARSSDLKTGVVNIPGVQQQYGKNFGRSVIPSGRRHPPTRLRLDVDKRRFATIEPRSQVFVGIVQMSVFCPRYVSCTQIRHAEA